MLYRNGSNFIDEADYNEWVINETILILDNNESLYNAYRNNINNLLRLRRIVYNTMNNESMKIKDKNIKAVIKYLIDNYEA